MAWRGAGRGAAGAPSSLEDLIRNQKRTNSSQPPQAAYYPPPQQSYHPHHTQPPSVANSKLGRSFQSEKSSSVHTPPRAADHDSVSFEYSPPGPGDHFSPFHSRAQPSLSTQPPSDGAYSFGGKSSSYPLFDQPSWSDHGGRTGTDGRGRGRGGRGRGPAQKFSCRVCNLSFDSKPLLTAHLHEKQHFNNPAADLTPAAHGNADTNINSSKRVFPCRVCNAVFDNTPSLYAHLNAEGHFHTTNQNTSEPSRGAEDAAPSTSHVNVSYPPEERAKIVQERPLRKPSPKPPDDADKVDMSRVEPLRPKPRPESGRQAQAVPAAAIAVKDRYPTFEAQAQSSPIPPSLPPPEVTLFTKGPKIADISGKNRAEEDDSAPVFRSSKFPAPSAAHPTAAVAAVPKIETKAATFSEQEEDGDDFHSDGQVVGTCTDMCPEEEIAVRLRANEVHLFEQPGDEASGLKSDELMEVLKATMIKQYQRSAADHKLAIPHLVRTPRHESSQPPPALSPLSPSGLSTTRCVTSSSTSCRWIVISMRR
jgi:hypothetical protein